MRVAMSLHATSKLNDDIFENCCSESHAQVERGNLYCQGVDGNARIYYILLRDVVDAVIKAELDGYFQQRVHGDIYALYGSEDKDCGYRLEDALYTASLLEFTGASGDSKGRHLGLTRSNLAVPSNGKLVIGVRITDLDTGIHILQGECTFLANRNGIFQEEISGTLCSLKSEANCRLE